MSERLYEIEPGQQIHRCPGCGASIVHIRRAVTGGKHAQRVLLTVEYRGGHFPQEGPEHTATRCQQQQEEQPHA